jgi:NitT/TauT family transport system substrate-binding protein
MSVSLALGGPIFGCSSPASPPRQSLDRVTCVTGFGTFGRDSYFWVANQKGFFREAGIGVTIQPGKGSEPNIGLVVANKAQFAALDFAAAMVHASKNGTSQIRLIGAIQQRTVVAIMSLKERGISRPADLVGRTIAGAAGAAEQTLFPTYAKLAGIDAAQVHWTNAEPPQLPALLASGKVDAIGQFIVGAPSIKKTAGGRETVTLPYSDYIGDLPGNVLVTQAGLTARDPDLVRRFTLALMRGLAYAIAHPDEAGQILHQAQPTSDPITAAAELRLMDAYVTSASTGVPVGALTGSRVARGIAILQSSGLIPSGLDPDNTTDLSIMGVA